MKRYSRTISANPQGLKGVEQATSIELSEIKPFVREKLRVEFNGDDIFLNLNPNPEECESLIKWYPKIMQVYGFVSPSVLIIEDYVEFYMLRYEEGHRESDVREGLKVEKAFDLMLQNAGLYVNYPEPVRDWRIGKGAPHPQPCDFYIPLLGKLEAKSVTDYNGSNRVNVPLDAWLEEKADYLLALSHVGGYYVMLCGAMPLKMVNSYVDGEYHIKHSNSPKFTGPFLSIPLVDFPIQPRRLYEALLATKQRIDKLPKVKLT